MMGLTRKQSEALDFIKSYMASHGGCPPSLLDMMRGLGLQSKSGPMRLLNGLEERGYIRRLRNRARTIEVVEQDTIRLSPDIRDALTQYRKRTNCSLQTAANELLREYLGKVAA